MNYTDLFEEESSDDKISKIRSRDINNALNPRKIDQQFSKDPMSSSLKIWGKERTILTLNLQIFWD